MSSEKPKRIQRIREKGFNLQETSLTTNGLSCVYVGRPGKYGNPYWHVEKYHGRGLSLDLYEQTAQGVWLPSALDGLPDGYISMTYQSHLEWLKRFQRHPLEIIRSELRGFNLACWCSIGQPCHADILLKLANG